jgi:dipeptidyl aminopeptidase/acylaminoacyl peptidase
LRVYFAIGGLGLGIIAVGVIAIAARSVAWVRQTTLQPARDHVGADATARAFAEIPGLEDATLHTSDGLTLRGWFAPGNRHAAVILVHGGWGNRLQLLAEARVFEKHGFGFLVYDSRACGESDGDLSTWGDSEQRDVVAALDYVAARPDIEPGRIGLLGHSIGASQVAMVGARDRRVHAVILYATWSSLEDEVRDKRKKFGELSLAPALWELRRVGVDFDNVRPIDHMAEIAPRPLLMITGGRDGDTPPPVMERLFRLAGQPKDFWLVPGSDHGAYLKTEPAEYERRVVAFLERSLGAASKPPSP